MPACCHGTADIAVEVSDAIARPAPTPTRTRPGMTTGQLEFSRRIAWASAPAAMTTRPLPTIQRGDVRCRNRPTCPDTRNAETAHGRMTRPALMALRPRTDWSHSD